MDDVIDAIFDIPGEKNSNKKIESDIDPIEKTAFRDGRYICDSSENARESLKRAAENESLDDFKKIAHKIKNIHPEISIDGSFEKTASLGLMIGEKMAEGFIKKIRSG